MLCDQAKSRDAVVGYLGGSIVGAATAGLQEMPITHDVTQPKVRNFDIHFAVQEEVFRLQVPVDNHVPVAVFHPGGDLLKEAASLFLQQSALLHNVVKKLTRLIAAWVR